MRRVDAATSVPFFVFFCVSLMSPRVASRRVLGRPCSTARLEYAASVLAVRFEFVGEC